MALSELKSKLNKLSTTDYFTDDSARGFTKDFKPGSFTKFQPYKLKLGQSDYFVDDYAKGFTLNMKSPNTGFKLNKTYPFEKTFGERNSSYNFFDLNFKVNDGFKKNFKLGESQYKNVQGKNFKWPLDLKRVDYQGNNLSPISDFERKFPNMVGGLSSMMSYPESKLRKQFLHSTNDRFRYKVRYEFKKENQIRLDSNSNTHPIILQSLMDVNRYGWAKNRLSNVGHTTDFVRGGITTHLGTALTDQIRLGKFLTSGSGLWWLGKQFVLQYLNPRKETQLYNPLHINASIIPFANVSRFIDIKGLGGGVATSMGFAKDGQGLYERTDGYDQWGWAGGRGEKNKLATYARERFDELESQSEGLILALQDKAYAEAERAKKAGILGKLGDGLKELAGKFRAESKPANIINSQQHMIDQKSQLGRAGSTGIHKDEVDATHPTNYETLPYKELVKKNAYGYKRSLNTNPELETPPWPSTRNQSIEKSTKLRNKIKNTGDASAPTQIVADSGEKANWYSDALGVHKRSYAGYHGDKVNILPYGNEETDLDLVKFQFKDMVNKKFIVFRATVSGLTDTISPEWGSEKYIGRADSVHVYKGAERSLSFGFTIAPTTKQELFTLWEKLNYLTGLTYPNYTDGNRMTAPWTEFTFGHMYKGVPGFIESLSYSIPDNAPYEIDGIELPKVIEATMGFKYVGNNLQTMQGKHFDLPWLEYADKDKLTTMERIELEPVHGLKQYHYTGRPNRGGEVSKALQLAGMPNQYKPLPTRPTVPMSDEEADMALDTWEDGQTAKAG